MTELQLLENVLPAEAPQLTVIRRKHQRTIRIRIKNDALLVSAPSGVPFPRIADFVRNKSDWIKKVCRKNRQKSDRLARLKEAARGTLLLRGERKPVNPFPVRNLCKPALVEHDRAVVFQYPAAAAASDLLYPDSDTVFAFYRKLARNELKEAFYRHADRLPFRPAGLTIRNQKTRWGSCSSRGTISLNWRLIKCPATIRDYIIIHELCHLKHFNHSKVFWKTVRDYYPGVDQAKSWIRKHSDIIFNDI